MTRVTAVTRLMRMMVMLITMATWMSTCNDVTRIMREESVIMYPLTWRTESMWRTGQQLWPQQMVWSGGSSGPGHSKYSWQR